MMYFHLKGFLRGERERERDMPGNSRELLVNNAFDDELVGLKAPLRF